MNKLTLIFFLSIFCVSVSFSQKKNTNTKPYPYGNPVITHMYTADAAPKVMPDGRLWMVTSVDHENGGGYATMHAIHAFSTDDMVTWIDHGEILGIDDFDVPKNEDWAIWAPDIVYRNGVYYLYFPMRNVLSDGSIDRYVAVAESDSMYKRFKITNPRMTGVEKAGLDPAVFIDDDGIAYLYWNQQLMGVLEANMREIKGNMFKLDIGANNFMEAAWMHKRKGVYYFNYHTKYNNVVSPENPNDPNRLKSNLDYSIGTSPKGPLTYQGTMNFELGSNVVNGPKLKDHNYVPWRLTQSNHGGVVEYHGQEYLFYHTSALSSWRQDEFNGEGTWTQRSVCIDALNYNEDGTIIPVQQTIEGVKKITINQPFSIQLKPKKAFHVEGLKTSKEKIISIKNTSSISFKNIDLGSGYYYFGVKLLKTPSKGKIEIRKDSVNGYLMGTILLDNNNSTLNKGYADTFLREANGIHHIVLVFINENSEQTIISEPHFLAGSPKKIEHQ
ncbi:carbohydrate-binding protein [Lutibacter sp. HS1-25]|uniref:family 43 glycosylhydrolase n=1 Tax=Lutibacter sp. HS1-25 TaxID=2485000 RepID=UPI00101035F7|nr:family 43 glycosylhydrolase [Lutibacter sp. HS1-25]RXP62725.1 carbohydrate-binding protein [Lutibacter sp. HS1-25]